MFGRAAFGMNNPLSKFHEHKNYPPKQSPVKGHPSARDNQRQGKGFTVMTKTTTTYSCSYCSKIFNSLTGLKCHLPKHTGHYRHWCELCQKGFNSATHYNKHMSNKHMMGGYGGE